MAGKKLTDPSIATRSAPIPASALMRWVTDPAGTPTDEKSSLSTLLATIGQSTMGPLTLSSTSADLAMTWNSGGTTYTGLKLNVTDTASNAASLLLDLQVGGASRFRVSKGGTAIIATRLVVASNSATKAIQVAAGDDSFVKVQIDGASGNDGAVINSSLGRFAWTSGAANGTIDLALYRDAANTLAQRNGASAQTLNIYNTYTNASNYERGGLKWSSSVLELFSEAAGTGTVRALSLTPAAINMPNLPTSDPGVSGRLWNDGGTLKVSA